MDNFSDKKTGNSAGKRERYAGEDGYGLSGTSTGTG